MPSEFSFITPDEPLTGIVAAAAISGTLALRVLEMVLEISAHKHDPERLERLITAARREAGNLARLAREDGAAYAAYVEARKAHSPETEFALRTAIQTPLAAAHSASAGIDICVEATGVVQGAMSADVSGAAALLAGAVSAILCSVDANLRSVKDAAFAGEVAAERRELEAKATREAEETARRVSTDSQRPKADG